jgi:glyoxylase-like metal-dependent hydrolase (beta-lactamase superfamily II)
MVDGQFAPLHDKLKAAIAAVTQQPVRFLVNTHYHRDVGGNVPFSKDGAVVVAHENVRKRLAEGTTMAVPEVKYTPAPEEALPAITHKEGMILQVQGRTAQLKHPVNAHTDGDTYVYFADANVLSTGDTVTIGRYPNIDFANGGSINGMIATADAYLSITDDNSKIVPGHGPLATKAQITAQRLGDHSANEKKGFWHDQTGFFTMTPGRPLAGSSHSTTISISVAIALRKVQATGE